MYKSIRQYLAALGKRGFIVAALLVGDIIGIIQSYFTNFAFPQWAWWIILTTILIISPFIAFNNMRRHRDSLMKELEDIRNAKPNIVFKRVEENFEGSVSRRVWSNKLSQFLIGPSEPVNFTRIWVANEPLISAVDAIKLFGEIQFWNESGESLLFTMGGRWAETKEIAAGGQPIEIEQMDMPPNGRPFCMDIGLKYLEEEEFFGYNNETPRKRTNGWRDQDRKLCAGKYLVRARFRCKGVDTSFWFNLNNKGKNQLVTFEYISSPPPTIAL
jgi:hypothetical protein